jgi:hypothetical protein
MAQQVNAARIEVAEDLLVDLRSEDLAPGSVSEWPNRGSLGGVFRAFGNPVVETVGDWETDVVSFDGVSYFEGPVSPQGIVGGGTRSIEVWAYNIGESKEECMVAWSHRGGPDGTNMTFNYGWKDFGAAGHWGDDADMAWEGFDNALGGTGGYPPLETWWHLVYTYDGSTIRLYVNGELNNARTVAINTHSVNIIRIGAQNDNDGTAKMGDRVFSGAIAQVRIHDGVLTPEQIQNNAQIRIQTSGKASNPSPENGDPDVPIRDLILSWEPGLYPGTHTVYFSEEMNAVESGTAEVATALSIASYGPGPLNYETTYYWRVDEVNASPDKTVHEGSVWSFTTEPYVVPIPAQAISATASSQAEDQEPENTIDESGLVDDLHSTETTDMWATVEGQALPAWIQYEFDKACKLHEMLVWNYNGVSFLASLGLQDVTVEYSTDGVNWILNDSVSVFNKATGTDDYATNTTVPFGDVPVKYVKITVNSNWSGNLMEQYGLSEVRFFYIPVRARAPNPQSGAKDVDVDVDVVLSWRAGREAAEHRVFISNDMKAVIGGTAPVETVTEARYDPQPLDLGRTYYWRVDEVNDSETPDTWEGEVWNFATSDFLTVDDMESYGNAAVPGQPGSYIWYTWTDGEGWTGPPPGYEGNGTGSVVELSTDPALDMQSLACNYDNDGTNSLDKSGKLYYSEVTAAIDDLSVDPDWTRSGVRALTLWFHGTADNDANEQMYVKVNDAKVPYDGDMNDIREASWHEWSIDLADFGIGLTNVTRIAIGFGDEANTTQGGSGKVYFDDIRLYPARCVLSKRSADFAKVDFAPAGYPAGDCIVDYREIEIMGRDWLFEDQIIAPTGDPGFTGVHAYYPLNEGQGTTVFDLSGNNTDGTINNPSGGLGIGGSVWGTDSERGTVLSFNGDDSSGAYVSAGTIPALGLADNFTWAFWAKQAGDGTGVNEVILGNRDGGTQSPLQFIKFTPTNFEYYNAGNGMSIDYNDVTGGLWIHHAVVKSGTTLTYYRNGVNSGTSTVTSTIDENPFLIGGDVTRERWGGWISEVRLYSRALSQAEIAYLADTNPGDGQLHVPVPSAAELYEAEPEGSRSVDLKDFAVLADVWLEQQLWPAW